MRDKELEKRDTVGSGPRRPYSAPRLVVYGAVKDLTTGGSAGDSELLNPAGRPRQGPNKNRA